jgi:hypothetical protein
MGKPVGGVEGCDSESKEQRELEVYLEILAGSIGFAVAFFPLHGTKNGGPCQNSGGNPANCHAPLRHRKTGSRLGTKQAIFPT